MKRILTVLLILAFAVSCTQYVPIWIPSPGNDGGGYEETLEVRTWDGTSDTSWYTVDATAYYLDTPEEIAGLAELVNKTTDNVNFEGKIIYLDPAIYDMSAAEWTPIGNGERTSQASATASTFRFAGGFDGQGSIIKGLKINDTDNPDADDNHGYGLFGILSGGNSSSNVKGAELRNLTIEDAEITANSNSVGGAVGFLAYASVENVTVKNSVVTGAQGVGAVVGRFHFSGEILNCVNENTTVKTGEGTAFDMSGSNNNVGGILGIVQRGVSGEPYSVSGNSVILTGSSAYIFGEDGATAGIVGHVNGAVTMDYNTLQVVASSQIYAETEGAKVCWIMEGGGTGNSIPKSFAGNRYKVGNSEYVAVTGTDTDDQLINN